MPSQTFTAAYERHSQRILRLCLRYSGGSLAWAQDLTQETFLRLLKHMPSLTDTQDIEGWLITVATRLCLNRLHRESTVLGRVLLKLSGTATEATPAADSLFELQESAQRALAGVQQLPPKERMVMWLLVADGQTQTEICQTLGYSKGYVSKLVARGRTLLAQAGWEAGDEAS